MTVTPDLPNASAATREYYRLPPSVHEIAESVITPTASRMELLLKFGTLLEALKECEEYFDNRADADCDQDGYIPNEEMKLLGVVRDAIKKVSAK